MAALQQVAARCYRVFGKQDVNLPLASVFANKKIFAAISNCISKLESKIILLYSKTIKHYKICKKNSQNFNFLKNLSKILYQYIFQNSPINLW